MAGSIHLLMCSVKRSVGEFQMKDASRKQESSAKEKEKDKGICICTDDLSVSHCIIESGGWIGVGKDVLEEEKKLEEEEEDPNIVLLYSSAGKEFMFELITSGRTYFVKVRTEGCLSSPP